MLDTILARKEEERVKLNRQLVVRPSKYADSQRFELMFEGEIISAEISLVWMTMLKVTEKSIFMVKCGEGVRVG